MARMRRLLQGMALAAGLSGLTAGAAQARDLVIAMPNWPSGQVTANILKIGLKKQFNLEATVTEMGTLIAFNGLNGGDVDIHPEVWLPNLDNLVKKYVTDAGTVAVSPVGGEGWQGICATRAAADGAGIKDIADLSDAKKTAALDTDGDGKGELWIGAPTWSSTTIERIRANSYGYANTLSLFETPEDVGMAAVDAAEATDRPMVFACYAPHVVFKLHDIVRLTEPPYDAAKWKIVLPTEDAEWLSKSSASVGWDKAHFHIAYATALGKQHPEVAKFLERVSFSAEEATEMSYGVQVDGKTPAELAERWVAAHEERIKEWAKP